MGDIKLQDMNTNTLLGLFHLVFDFLFHILLSFLHDQDLAVCKIFFQVFLVKFYKVLSKLTAVIYNKLFNRMEI